jgi:murein DD-endopeptidase MepM/ murein hydrolase activator NlpD
LQEKEVLTTQLQTLNQQVDQMQVVMIDLQQRDDNLYRVLFGAEPIPMSVRQGAQRKIDYYETLAQMTNSQMAADLTNKIDKLEKELYIQAKSYDEVLELAKNKEIRMEHIPAIQPVINDELTLLTAGYGTILSPFYRTMKSHQGVDYSIGEGSSVFATADGVVKEISDKNSTLGKTIIIDHGNGYQTSYSHLLESLVKRGQQVNRGDVIALSGNSGLSLAPHLHYEVRYNDMRVNPIHFFFMELSPEGYQRIIQISQSGMQSLD